VAVGAGFGSGGVLSARRVCAAVSGPELAMVRVESAAARGTESIATWAQRWFR
jgi:hypothetical protein